MGEGPGGPGHRRFRPVELGCVTLSVWMCAPSRKLSGARPVGIYGTSLCRPGTAHGLPSQPLPLPGYLVGGGVDLKVPSVQSPLLFLETSPHPGAVQEPPSHLIRTEDALRALVTLSRGERGGLQEPRAAPGQEGGPETRTEVPCDLTRFDFRTM